MLKLKKFLIIPDCHVREDTPLEHLSWIGQYIIDKRPDVIVNLGDFADMESLNSYDKEGRKTAFEGRRYKKDISIAKHGMELMLWPMLKSNATAKSAHRARYRPEMHLTIGNHEARITRAVEHDPVLEGSIGIDDLGYERYWTVHEYLKPIGLDGIQFAHFFPRSPNGRILQNKRGAPSASAMVRREACSCVAGHLQGLDFYIYQGSRRMYGLIAGSCYLHSESYLGPADQEYWRGIVVLHEVHDGQYDLMLVSLDYLRRKYS